ncbi:MAG: universal stress protein, partial [Gemmatimonadales bacterium]|nr:universal stress protein [Gemmatimonadales bacterium]
MVVGVTASPHAKLALEIAEAISRDSGGKVRHLHVVKAGTGMDPETIRNYLTDDARKHGAPAIETVEATTTAKGMLEHSKEADLLVLGAAREPILRQYMFGDKTQRVARAARCPVLMVKRHPSPAQSILRRLFAPA